MAPGNEEVLRWTGGSYFDVASGHGMTCRTRPHVLLCEHLLTPYGGKGLDWARDSFDFGQSHDRISVRDLHGLHCAPPTARTRVPLHAVHSQCPRALFARPGLSISPYAPVCGWRAARRWSARWASCRSIGASSGETSRSRCTSCRWRAQSACSLGRGREGERIALVLIRAVTCDAAPVRVGHPRTQAHDLAADHVSDCSLVRNGGRRAPSHPGRASRMHAGGGGSTVRTKREREGGVVRGRWAEERHVP